MTENTEALVADLSKAFCALDFEERMQALKALLVALVRDTAAIGVESEGHKEVNAIRVLQRDYARRLCQRVFERAED